MDEYVEKRRAELQKEFNEALLQKMNLEAQLKSYEARIEQLRGAFSELNSIPKNQ